MTALVVTVRDEDGKSLGTFVANAKDFKTGSQGYHGAAKLTIGGERYQVQLQAVRIGSKAAADAVFAAAFGYTPDCSIKPAFAAMSSASTTGQRLAGQRRPGQSGTRLYRHIAHEPSRRADSGGGHQGTTGITKTRFQVRETVGI